MQRALCVATCIALAAFSFAFLELGLAIRREVPRFDSTLQNLDQGSKALLDAATQQVLHLKAQLEESRKATADIHDFFIHLDLSVNGRHGHPGLIPTATKVLDQQNEALLTVEHQATFALMHLDNALEQAAPLLASLTDASANLAALAADPHLKEALERLDDAIGEANAVLVQLDGMASSGNEMAAMLRERLRQALKPASFAKRIFMGLLGLAGPAAQVATAAK